MSDIINQKNIGKTLAKENESINTYINDIKEIATEEKKEVLFPIKDIKNKILQRYPKEIENALDSLLEKNNLTQYKENFNKDGTIKNTDKISKTDKKKLEKISTRIDEAVTTLAQQEQTKMFEETNKVIKTKVIETLIKNIGQYFEITSFQRGNMAEQFSIDTKNGIKFDKEMISLSGNMDDKQIRFYYDINNGEIRADDFIHLDKETYYINNQKEKIGREKLPIKIDTMSQIMDTTKKTAQANIQKSIETSKSQQEYTKELANKTSVEYKQQSPITKTIIEHTMEKNTAIQETHDFIQKYLPTKEAYNKQ